MDRLHASSPTKGEDEQIAVAAASEAVAGILRHVQELGGSLEQGEALRDAIRLGLLDKFDEAKRRMLKGGFDESFSAGFLDDLRAEKSAA